MTFSCFSDFYFFFPKDISIRINCHNIFFLIIHLFSHEVCNPRFDIDDCLLIRNRSFHLESLFVSYSPFPMVIYGNECCLGTTAYDYRNINVSCSKLLSDARRSVSFL